jgi:hypothetical protein
MFQEGMARPRYGPFEPKYLHSDEFEVEQCEVKVVRRVDVTGQERQKLGLLL